MPHDGELCHSHKVATLTQTAKPVALKLLLPHWLIVAGAFLAMSGFVGLAFHRNKRGGGLQKNLSREPEARSD